MLPPAVETLVEEEPGADVSIFDAEVVADAGAEVVSLKLLVDTAVASVEAEVEVLSVVVVPMSIPDISPIPVIPPMSDIPPIPIFMEVVVAAEKFPEAPDAVESIAFAKYEKEEILSICSLPFLASNAATCVSVVI